MKVFIDTSSLIKRFHYEKGSDELVKILKEVTELVVAPTTYLETLNTFKRLFTEKKINSSQFKNVMQTVNRHFGSFSVVLWDDALEEVIVKNVLKYGLRSLDIIQLSSAHISQAKVFISSDKQLVKIAGESIDQTIFVG